MNADRASRPPPTVTTNEDEALGRPMSKPAEPLPVRNPVDESNRGVLPGERPSVVVGGAMRRWLHVGAPSRLRRTLC